MLVLPALVLLGCAEVPVDSASDFPLRAGLSGELVTSEAAESLGDALVLIYDVNDPPPPSGFGRPKDFSVVPAESWGDAGAGVRAASWSMAAVNPGSYLVTGLVDNDADFNPFFDFTAGATCGDQPGAYLSNLLTQQLGVVTMQEGEVRDHIAVTIGSALTVERPAFTIGGLSSVDLATPGSDPTPIQVITAAAPQTIAQFMTFSSVGIETPFFRLNSPSAAQCPARFLVTLTDADGDGALDPHTNPQLAALGLYDLWPKVYLIYLQGLDGTAPEAGHSWVAEAPIYPVALVPPYGTHFPGETFTTDSLTTLFIPAAQHSYTSEEGEEVSEIVGAADMPAGYWAIAVVSQTGQVWVVPNQLADETLAGAYGYSVDASQAVAVPIQ